MPDPVNLKWLPVFGLGMEKSVELLEPLHAKEASWANLQCDDVSVVGVRTGISEVLIPLSSWCLLDSHCSYMRGSQSCVYACGHVVQ